MTLDQLNYFAGGFLVGGCFVVLLGIFIDEIKRDK